MAKRLGDHAALAYASTARHFACQRPEVAPNNRIQLADQAIALIEDAPASDVLAFAFQERMVDLLELGHGTEFNEAFAGFERTVNALGQPFFLWLLSLFRGTRALLSGDIAEAERLASVTLEMGSRIRSPNAEGVFAGQSFSVRREQGWLGELALAFDAVAERHAALPVFRAGRAAVAAAGGDRAEANRHLEEIMRHDLDDFPRDQNWIAALGTLAPAAIAVGSEARMRQLVSFLEPYRARMIVVGQGATTHGAVSHHLGLLYAGLGETDRALAHLESAKSIHARAGATLWLQHTTRAIASL